MNGPTAHANPQWSFRPRVDDGSYARASIPRLERHEGLARAPHAPDHAAIDDDVRLAGHADHTADQVPALRREVLPPQDHVTVRKRLALEIAVVPGQRQDLEVPAQLAPLIDSGRGLVESQLGLAHRADPADQPAAHVLAGREPRQRADDLLARIDPERVAVVRPLVLHRSSPRGAGPESPSRPVSSNSAATEPATSCPVSSHTRRAMSSSDPSPAPAAAQARSRVPPPPGVLASRR